MFFECFQESISLQDVTNGSDTASVFQLENRSEETRTCDLGIVVIHSKNYDYSILELQLLQRLDACLVIAIVPILRLRKQ